MERSSSKAEYCPFGSAVETRFDRSVEVVIIRDALSYVHGMLEGKISIRPHRAHA